MATQKIHFFTGKGGVGKTVLTASYALAASATNSTTLLTELSEESALSTLFPAHKKPQNLSLDKWNAYGCLEEYASLLIHSASLSKLFLNNPLSRSLINVAPGLQELAVLGKATSGPRNIGKPMNYDEIFIDSYSSGHFLSLMTAPQSFAEIFSFGPMATQSQSIDLWIKNAEFTSVHIVTQADELSIQEALELWKNLKDLKIKADFILNRFVDTSAINFKKLPEKTRHFFENIQVQQSFAQAELKKIKTPTTLIPQAFETDLFKIVLATATHIKDINEV